jgi:hypothetical protein
MNPLNIQDLLGLIISFMPPERQLVHRRVCKEWKKVIEKREKFGEWWVLYHNRDSIFAYQGLSKAAELGFKSLVNLFISKGAKNWGQGLYKAAKGGHRDLVDFFMEKGGVFAIDKGLYQAARRNDRDMAIFLC